jgi:multidrug resistance efflux pump
MFDLTTGRYLETTDDAYVKADSTIISPKVSGYIAEVLVGDNQPVKVGQLLARIDDRDFRAALGLANADVPAAEAAVRNLDTQLALQQPIIEQSTADIAAAPIGNTAAAVPVEPHSILSRSFRACRQIRCRNGSLLPSCGKMHFRHRHNVLCFSRAPH